MPKPNTKDFYQPGFSAVGENDESYASEQVDDQEAQGKRPREDVEFTDLLEPVAKRNKLSEQIDPEYDWSALAPGFLSEDFSLSVPQTNLETNSVFADPNQFDLQGNPMFTGETLDSETLQLQQAEMPLMSNDTFEAMLSEGSFVSDIQPEDPATKMLLQKIKDFGPFIINKSFARVPKTLLYQLLITNLGKGLQFWSDLLGISSKHFKYYFSTIGHTFESFLKLSPEEVRQLDGPITLKLPEEHSPNYAAELLDLVKSITPFLHIPKEFIYRLLKIDPEKNIIYWSKEIGVSYTVLEKFFQKIGHTFQSFLQLSLEEVRQLDCPMLIKLLEENNPSYANQLLNLVKSIKPFPRIQKEFIYRLFKTDPGKDIAYWSKESGISHYTFREYFQKIGHTFQSFLQLSLEEVRQLDSPILIKLLDENSPDYAVELLDLVRSVKPLSRIPKEFIYRLLKTDQKKDIKYWSKEIGVSCNAFRAYFENIGHTFQGFPQHFLDEVQQLDLEGGLAPGCVLIKKNSRQQTQNLAPMNYPIYFTVADLNPKGLTSFIIRSTPPCVLANENSEQQAQNLGSMNTSVYFAETAFDPKELITTTTTTSSSSEPELQQIETSPISNNTSGLLFSEGGLICDIQPEDSSEEALLRKIKEYGPFGKKNPFSRIPKEFIYKLLKTDQGKDVTYWSKEIGVSCTIFREYFQKIGHTFRSFLLLSLERVQRMDSEEELVSNRLLINQNSGQQAQDSGQMNSPIYSTVPHEQQVEIPPISNDILQLLFASGEHIPNIQPEESLEETLLRKVKEHSSFDGKKSLARVPKILLYQLFLTDLEKGAQFWSDLLGVSYNSFRSYFFAVRHTFKSFRGMSFEEVKRLFLPPLSRKLPEVNSPNYAAEMLDLVKNFSSFSDVPKEFVYKLLKTDSEKDIQQWSKEIGIRDTVFNMYFRKIGHTFQSFLKLSLEEIQRLDSEEELVPNRELVNKNSRQQAQTLSQMNSSIDSMGQELNIENLKKSIHMRLKKLGAQHAQLNSSWPSWEAGDFFHKLYPFSIYDTITSLSILHHFGFTKRNSATLMSDIENKFQIEPNKGYITAYLYNDYPFLRGFGYHPLLVLISMSLEEAAFAIPEYNKTTSARREINDRVPKNSFSTAPSQAFFRSPKDASRGFSQMQNQITSQQTAVVAAENPLSIQGRTNSLI